MSDPIVSAGEEPPRKDTVELVGKTVQDTLDALLGQEAEEMVGAGRHERTAGRGAYRSGHCKRKLATTSGQIEPDVPKLRGAAFRTAVIERCPDARPASRRPSSRRAWPASPPGASRTSARSSGAPGSRQAPSPTSPRGPASPWRSCAAGRWPASIPTSSPTAPT